MKRPTLNCPRCPATEQTATDMKKHILNQHCIFCGQSGQLKKYNRLDNFGYNQGLFTRVRERIAKRRTPGISDYSGGVNHPVISELLDSVDETEIDGGTLRDLKDMDFARHPGSVCSACEEKYKVIIENAQERDADIL